MTSCQPGLEAIFSSPLSQIAHLLTRLGLLRFKLTGDFVAGQEQAQADRGSLMAGLLEKGSQEVGLLKRQTSQGQPVELTEATLWAVEAPTGESPPPPPLPLSP